MKICTICKILTSNFHVAARNKDGLEKNWYESYSSHVLLKLIPFGKFIGTVRLILSDKLNQKKFPIETHVKPDPKLCDINKLSRKHTAEFLVLLS